MLPISDIRRCSLDDSHFTEVNTFFLSANKQFNTVIMLFYPIKKNTFRSEEPVINSDQNSACYR
jgi:hypothetical protein